MKILKKTEKNITELDKRFKKHTKEDFNIHAIINEINDNDILINRGEYELASHETKSGHIHHIEFNDLIEDVSYVAINLSQKLLREIKLAIKDHGLTISDLAKPLNIPKETIIDTLSEEYPSLEKLFLIAEYFYDIDANTLKLNQKNN